jgi:hypothetical protein
MGSMDAYADAMASTRSALLQDPELPELVRNATLAASGHNTQPWRFRVSDKRIEYCQIFQSAPLSSTPTTITCSRVSAAPPKPWPLRPGGVDARES